MLNIAEERERDLGRLLSEHRPPRSLKVMVLLAAPICMLVGAGMLVAALVPDPRASSLAKVLVPLFGLGFIGLGVAVVLVWRRKSATVVQLYEGGLVELCRDVRREISWSSVDNFRYASYSTVLELRIYLVDGSRMIFNSQHLQGLDAIANAVGSAVTISSLPELRRRLEGEQPVIFGKLALSRQGLHYGRRKLAWSEVASVWVHGGFLHIVRHGDATPSLRVSVARLERVDALLQLVRERRSRPAASAPFAPSSSFRRVIRSLWLKAVLVVPLIGFFAGFGGYYLWRALAQREPPASSMAGALALIVLGAFLGLGFAHDVMLPIRRQRLARRLARSGKLAKVMVLESGVDEWSFHVTSRYRYLTPGGVEATDSVEKSAGGAEPWSDADGHLLALCSEDERESVLLCASGYPLAALPTRPGS